MTRHTLGGGYPGNTWQARVNLYAAHRVCKTETQSQSRRTMLRQPSLDRWWSQHVAMAICVIFLWISVVDCFSNNDISYSSVQPEFDSLFVNSSIKVEDRPIVMEHVLNHLIHYGYLSRGLKVRSNALKRPLLDFIDVNTVQRALREYQHMMELPITGRIDLPTLHDQAMPRCGNKDIPLPILPYYRPQRVRRYKTHFNKKRRWTKTHLTYRISNYPNQSLSNQKVHRILRQAVNAWARHSKLTFEELKDQQRRADIRFSFNSRKHGDGISFDGTEGILAHAFFPLSGELTGAVHFDNDENWTDRTYDGKNLLGVAVHELGHSLGLQHSDNKGAIMFGIFIGYQPHFRLHQDDIDGIQHLYGKPQPNKVLEEDDDYYTGPPIIPTTAAPTTLKPGLPNVCRTPVDTILPMREFETHVFYERFFWRVASSETGDGLFSYGIKDQPRPFNEYWRALPANLDRIDAAYERQTDNYFMFFRGNRYWVLADNNNLVNSVTFPKEGRLIQELGLPSSVKKIDTIFPWGYRPTYKPKHRRMNSRIQRTFLFAGGQYWEFVEKMGKFGAVKRRRYPKRIADVWLDVPTPIDAAYTHVDGETYFFKDYYYYMFNNRIMSVRDGYPKPNQLPWLGCT